MPSRCRAVLVAIAIAAMAASPAGAERTWRRLVTPNFEVIGDVGERQLRNTARELELFCEAFKQVFPNARITPPTPTTVVVFSSNKAFEPFAPLYEDKPRQVGGYYTASGDRAFILLNDLPRQQAYPLVFHELTHLVQHNTLASAPVWFTEGLAEYYSTFRMEGRDAILGFPDGENLRLLQSNWLPFATLLTVDQTSPHYNERHRASVFYAQSWALVHYFLSDQGRSKQMFDLLARLARGETPSVAVPGALGIDLQKLDDEVRRYVFKRMYNFWRVTLAEKIEMERQAVEVIPEAAVAARRGSIFEALGRAADAEAELRRALTLDAGQPEAHVGLGLLAESAGKSDEARAHFARAADLAPDDYLAQYHHGSALLRHPRSDDGDMAVRVLTRAATLRPDSPECHYRLTYALLREGRAEEADAAVSRAMSLLPGAWHYRLALAEVRRGQRRFAEARSLLGPLMAQGERPGIQASARELMTRLVDDERRAAARAAGRADGAASDAETNGAAMAGDVIPIYRSVQADEERETGTWVGLDCDRSAIVVHVRVGGQVKSYRGTWESVEFSSHRPDRQGNITCGPRAEPEAVYVTSRPAPDGSRELVAIEILPS